MAFQYIGHRSRNSQSFAASSFPTEFVQLTKYNDRTLNAANLRTYRLPNHECVYQHNWGTEAQENELLQTAFDLLMDCRYDVVKGSLGPIHWSEVKALAAWLELQPKDSFVISRQDLNELLQQNLEVAA